MEISSKGHYYLVYEGKVLINMMLKLLLNAWAFTFFIYILTKAVDIHFADKESELESTSPESHTVPKWQR